MSIADYAEELGVTAATLYSWRRRLGGALAEAAPVTDPLGLIEVKVSRSTSAQPSPDLVVSLASGREVRVPDGFDAASLRRLIEVLESC
jgi:transposase-like protein